MANIKRHTKNNKLNRNRSMDLILVVDEYDNNDHDDVKKKPIYYYTVQCFGHGR
jgi:hypothetical protein